MADLMTQFGDYNVRILQKDERYGREDCLIHNEEEPLIEFYFAQNPDKVDPFWLRGVFVSRYYAETLMKNRSLQKGLCLHGNECYVPADDMKGIIEWAEEKLPAVVNKIFRHNCEKLISILQKSGLWKRDIADLQKVMQLDYQKIISLEVEKSPVEPWLCQSIYEWNVIEMDFRPSGISEEAVEIAHNQTMIQFREILSSAITKFQLPVIHGKEFDFSLEYCVEEIGKPFYKNGPIGDGTRRAWYYKIYPGQKNNGDIYKIITPTLAIYWLEGDCLEF